MRQVAAIVTAIALAICQPAFAQGADTAKVVSACGSQTYVAGTTASTTQDTTGNQCSTATATVAGSVTANQGTPNAGGAAAWPVTQASQPLPTGAATAALQSQPLSNAGVGTTTALTIQGNASGLAVPVSQATASNLNATVVGTGTFPVQSTQSPSSASTAGVAPVQSSAVETGHIIKASAGNLYDFNVSADATLSAAAWSVLIFNSTTVPAAGSVTPAKCYLLPSGTTSYSAAFPTPMFLGTGISIAVSTGQTCFTKTDSAHGFISADAQ